MILIGPLVVAASLGIWLRVSVLSVGSLWMDELWTLDAVSRSFIGMARLLPSDSKPPLWSMLSWVWLRVSGTYDVGTVRLLPLFFGLAAIAAPVLGAARMRSLRTPMLVLASLTAVSLFALHYSVELRAYAMMMAFGTAATVLWAGLLTGELPRRGTWIFLFALMGALSGFSHYYGHLLYGGELLALVVTWRWKRPHGPLAILAGWAALSLLPISAWYFLTRGRFPSEPVADVPSWSIVQTWLAYAFAPVSNLVAGHGLRYIYPDESRGIEVILAAATGLAIVGVIVWSLTRQGRDRQLQPASIVGAWCLLIIVAGVAGAWAASIVLPPSMNPRNLAALLPLLYLAIACAATQARSERLNQLMGAAVVAVSVLATVVLVTRLGTAAFAPAWQTDAGYRATARALLASSSETPGRMLIGLKLPWNWHGEWDAAVRAELGSPPAVANDPPPLDVRWVMDVEELRSLGLPASPLILFTDSGGPRWEALLAWVQQARSGCVTSTLGGPGYGMILLARCPASG